MAIAKWSSPRTNPTTHRRCTKGGHFSKIVRGYRILEVLNYERTTHTPAEWIEIFEWRFPPTTPTAVSPAHSACATLFAVGAQRPTFETIPSARIPESQSKRSLRLVHFRLFAGVSGTVWSSPEVSQQRIAPSLVVRRSTSFLSFVHVAPAHTGSVPDTFPPQESCNSSARARSFTRHISFRVMKKINHPRRSGRADTDSRRRRCTAHFHRHYQCRRSSRGASDGRRTRKGRHEVGLPARCEEDASKTGQNDLLQNWTRMRS